MDEVYNYLVKDSGIKYKDTVVVGVSGGPDSMSLLHLINRIKKEMDLFVVVAHVNHNVRKESDSERKFLQKYCDDAGLYFEYMKIENYGEDNFHNEARSIRYNYFDKICKQYSAKFLLTAHHADDLMETILMRIVRGSTLKGYSGFQKMIHKGEYIILRPLITVTKDQLLKYAKDNSIPYVIDKSNEKEVYTRNRYRKHVLPFLKGEDSNVHLKFLKFSETLMEYNNFVEKQLGIVMTKVFKQGLIDINKFLEIDHILQTKLIYNILEHIYGDDLLIISDTHVNLIFNLIKSGKANSIVHLPNNVKAIKTYDKISFNYDDVEDNDYEVEIDKIVNLPNGMNIEVLEKTDDTSNFVTRLSTNDIVFPLTVRTRKNGDKMDVKGMSGRKKVNDMFIDEKISMRERKLWPVVIDATGKIVWIPGLKKSKFDKNINEEYDIILKYY